MFAFNRVRLVISFFVVRLVISILAIVLLVPIGAVAYPTSFVDGKRLDRAPRHEDGSWLTYNHDRGAQRFSNLTQITTANVDKLQTAWGATLSKPVSLEGTPLVDGRVMYVTTGKDVVLALNARTGKILWRYRYALPDLGGHICCNFNNRGVTLARDLVVMGTLDAHLVAIDRRTGKVRWNTTVADTSKGYSITSPPLYVDGLLVTGVGGAEIDGFRGFIAAYDAGSGRERWRIATVPPDVGGGSTWVQGSYDRLSDTLYWGVGNNDPGYVIPQGDVMRRHTDSMIALDPHSGRLLWRFTYTPGDMWDYDGVNESVVIDVRRNGRLIHCIAHPDRNGYLYLFDRQRRTVLYAVPFIDRINWGRVDRTTGVARSNAALRAKAETGIPVTFFPSAFGAKNWGPSASDQSRGRMFIASVETGERFQYQVTPTPFFGFVASVRRFLGTWKRAILGLSPPDQPRTNGYDMDIPASPAYGTLRAFDLATGRQIWRTRLRTPLLGGVLATAGNLVFGGSPDGDLLGFDATDGRVVWREHVVGGITAPPITYEIAGRQYVAVEIGFGGVWPLFHLSITPWLRKTALTSRVQAFALPPNVAAKTRSM